MHRNPRFETSLITLLLLGTLFSGCSSRSQGGGAVQAVASGAGAASAGSGAAPAAAPAHVAAAAPMTPADAAAKAREILQRQIDATRANDDSIRQTFTPDAIICTQDKATSVEAVTFFGLADSGPDGTQNEKATIASLVAGGNADAVWFYAEVATESSGPGGKESATTRVVEIASAAERWRVVAASFGEASELLHAADNWEIAGATSADGPLAKLLGSPGTVGAQLAPDAIVISPKAAAQGPSARDALAAWKLEPLRVYMRAREVTTPTWGFAQANLDHPNGRYTDRMAGLVVAVPAGDHWTVVLAAYVHR